jgi:hypothetical protein
VRAARDRGQADETDSVRERVDQPRGGLDHHTGLADSARAGERHDPSLAAQERRHAGHLGLAPDQRRGRRGKGDPRRERREPRVLGQDRGLELAELASRVEPELLAQRPRSIAICREGVGLAPCPVKREHELGAQSFAQGLGLHETVEHGHEFGMAAQCEQRVPPLLAHDQAHLLEARDLRLRERLIAEVGERRAAPEPDRLLEPRRRPDRVARRERARAVVGQPGEDVGVNRVPVERETVAPRIGLDRRRCLRERTPQLRDVHLHAVRRRLGGIVAPYRLHQHVAGHHLARVQHQHGEQRTLLRPPQAGRPCDLQRSEDPDDHTGSCLHQSLHGSESELLNES